MLIQRTLSILKPDAVQRNLIGKINVKIEDAGLKIIAQKMIRLSLDQAKGFYAVHKDRPFFLDLCTFMTSSPIVAQVLEAKNAIERYRLVMGATNPKDALDGTIRKEFAISIQENSVHGSDSKENAQIEIQYFFSQYEMI